MEAPSMRIRKPQPPPQGEPPAGEGSSPEAARDALIEAEVERAVAPYRGLFPADVVHAFRERVAAYLTNDPQMIRLIDAALPRSGTHESAVRPTDAAGSARPTGRRKSG